MLGSKRNISRQQDKSQRGKIILCQKYSGNHPNMNFGRLLVGYNRSHFLCSNRHINTIVCFLGMGSGCFKLHNVLRWSWGTEKQSHKPPPLPTVGNSPMHTLLGNELGYFFSLPWLQALWQLHSAVGKEALPRASPQLQMTHAGRAPLSQI